MGEYMTFLNLCFLDKKKSKLVHTSSIYADNPYRWSIKKVFTKQKKIFYGYFIYNGAPLSM